MSGKQSLSILSCVICLFFAVTTVAKVPVTSARVKYNFNSNWKVFVGDPKGAETNSFDDSSWKSVTTPYAWNEDDAFKRDIKDLSTGIAWYRKHFKLPAEDAELFVLCYLEGYSYSELAEQFQAERGTIASRLHRIRAVLQKHLSR